MAEAHEGVDVLPPFPDRLLAAAAFLGPFQEPGQMGHQRQPGGGRRRPPEFPQGRGHRRPVEEAGRSPDVVGDAGGP